MHGNAYAHDLQVLNACITPGCYNGQATGKFAMGSNEALGRPSDFAESPLKAEILDEGKSPKNGSDMAKVFADGFKGSDAGPSSKRKRSLLSDDDCVVLSGMSQAVNNVADAIRDTKVPIVHPELYGAVMYIPGFSEDALIVAFNHLVDNKAQGTAFVGMTEAHRLLWLRNFLSTAIYG
jgi:hypothetical protein